jgi:hypothetical protein
MDKLDFLYPRNHYHGQWTPETLMFNANLQEFSQRVSYICNLETGGKLLPYEAYEKIESLWQQLKQTRQQLGIGASLSENCDD